MSTQEFSTEFDVLYNNVTSNQAPGLNEYEKSVFLTKAQSQLVNEYFNQRTDGFGGGFDGSQKRQYDFSSITKVENLFDINSYDERVISTEKLDRRSRVFLFPQNYFLAVNEILSDENWQYSVMPISHSEYQRLMLKPYNFPVKRGAWRIITNKKTCNFAHQDIDGKELGDSSYPNEFKMLSTWAESNSKINLTIIHPVMTWNPSDARNEIEKYGNIIRFRANIGGGYYCKITATKTQNSSNTDYNIVLTVNIDSDPQDNRVLEIIKDGFKQLRESYYWSDKSSTIVEAASRLDCLEKASAPEGTTKFSSDSGFTFNCKLVSIPTIELIGKFTGNVNYQLRYIRNLSPIILEDLGNYGTDLTIDGVKKATECELPEETHQEILERAVTLAKIAWQGGTMTGAAQQQAKNG